VNSRTIFAKIRYLLLFAGGFLIFFMIKRIGWGKFIEMVSSLYFPYVAVACMIWVLHLLLAAVRFRRFLYSDLHFIEIFEIFLFGYLYNYAGGVQGIGVAARLGMLKLKDVDISKSSASIGSEIVCDAAISAAILLGGIIFFGADLINQIQHIMTPRFLILPAIALVAVIFALIALSRKNLIQSFHESIVRSLLSKRILPGLSITLALFLLVSAVYFFIFRASGMNPGYFHIFFAFGSGYACGLLSLVPGGLGIRDIVFGYILSLSGIQFETGVSISIIVRVISIGIVFLTLILLQAFVFIIKRQQR
jgi:uncharacterized membrane protein YbhN (UPF0104 family)